MVEIFSTDQSGKIGRPMLNPKVNNTKECNQDTCAEHTISHLVMASITSTDDHSTMNPGHVTYPTVQEEKTDRAKDDTIIDMVQNI